MPEVPIPRAIPSELRPRIVTTYLNGEGSYKELAARFMVGEPSVNRFVRLHRKKGSLAPTLSPGRPAPRKFTAEVVEFMRSTVEAMPESTLAELHDGIREAFGLEVSLQGMHEVLRKRLGMTQKKGGLPKVVVAAPSSEGGLSSWQVVRSRPACEPVAIGPQGEVIVAEMTRAARRLGPASGSSAMIPPSLRCRRGT